jgi:hypothetical protein
VQALYKGEGEDYAQANKSAWGTYVRERAVWGSWARRGREGAGGRTKNASINRRHNRDGGKDRQWGKGRRGRREEEEEEERARVDRQSELAPAGQLGPLAVDRLTGGLRCWTGGREGCGRLEGHDAENEVVCRGECRGEKRREEGGERRSRVESLTFWFASSITSLSLSLSLSTTTTTILCLSLSYLPCLNLPPTSPP